ncbi:DNA-directed RNA polymerase [Exophiala viscosa]|uniref:DNA-directed RNA polymerase n=1 Tax=Exophiala viscosa TaxID=2486360 RepID=UPI00219F667D|nr:DNA-directed RNA polymerase [Exophiala viscosa]
MPRKRTRDEMEASEPEEKNSEPGLLKRIRNMWEFASVMQYIFTFGKAVKIDEDFDIEDFENECLKPGYSEKLEEIGLTLLKWISSHRGLDLNIWDEYTRRQYLAKAPHLNPYGDEEEPKRFRDFDIFTKIRVLHQMTVWTFWNPDRIRERMPEHQREVDQLEWRIEEFGYDRDDRQYYLLDDNRFYRRTEPPLPAAPKAKPKANSKKAIAARRRQSKRRRVETDTPEYEQENEDNDDESKMVDEKNLESWQVDTYGGFKWECLAITLSDYHELCEFFKKSKDPNEKLLYARLLSDVLPIIEESEEKQRRKIERRQRELMLMEKMVGAKRSSRLQGKQERERQEAEQAEAERKQQADLAAAHREQERQEKMEEERQYRMMTREQRIKDREYKRILKEEELARDALEQQRIEEGQVRGSGRHLKERIEKNKKELEDLNAEEEWTFDCSGCGIYGKNLDDGSHSVACDRCNVWQHSKCLGISKSAAEKDDFYFVCKDCRQKEEDAKKPKISLKFRVGASSSPAPPSPALPNAQSPTATKFVGVEIPRQNFGQPSGQGPAANGLPPQQSSSSPPPPSSPYYPRLVQNDRSYHLNSGALVSGHTQPLAPQHGLHTAAGQQPPTRPQSHPQMLQPGQVNINGATDRPLMPHGQQAPAYNGVPNQYQPVQTSPRQTVQSPSTGQRLPSPVFNRPTMSPTQGNMDVGPVAGILQKSPPMDQPVVNGAYGSSNGHMQQGHNGGNPHATPRASGQPRFAQTPTTQPFSGLSPKKQRTPATLPAPSMILQNPNSMSPPVVLPQQSPSGPVERRTVSGTPILPPVENLRPSPEQLKNSSSTEPVPTPSKQPQPAPQLYAGLENGLQIQNVPEQPSAGQNNAPQNQPVTAKVEPTIT